MVSFINEIFNFLIKDIVYLEVDSIDNELLKSANSWIVDKLINNHGGLYNRVTYEIKLNPFTLNEYGAFYEENRIRLSTYDIVQSYMIIGGIPYYMGYFKPGLSLGQNIVNMFFSNNAVLRNEFERLFASAFKGINRGVALLLSI